MHLSLCFGIQLRIIALLLFARRGSFITPTGAFFMKSLKEQVVVSSPARSRQRVRKVQAREQQQQQQLSTSSTTSTPRKLLASNTPAVVSPGPAETPLTSSLIETVNPTERFQVLKFAPPHELRPSATLTTGQCFHWRPIVGAQNPSLKESRSFSAWGIHNATEWIGVLRLPASKESVVLSIRETPSSTLYRKLAGKPLVDDLDQLLFHYFQLEHNVSELYTEWASQCSRLAAIAPCIPGLRIIDQDPWECLVSFICSSNNNIPRITKMVESIRRTYGDLLLTVGGHEFYSFPSLEKLLTEASDDDLRSRCGMGYRAKYLIETMNILHSLGGEDYLQHLRTIKDPTVVQEKLCQFTGVGRKVADCCALFSLQQHDAIPVDVHVWKIALRDYDSDATLRHSKSLTPTLYKQVGDLFRTRFPRMSGWAHSLLFVAELPSFRGALPLSLVEEMDKFREEERDRKKRKRETKN